MSVLISCRFSVSVWNGLSLSRSLCLVLIHCILNSRLSNFSTNEYEYCIILCRRFCGEYAVKMYLQSFLYLYVSSVHVMTRASVDFVRQTNENWIWSYTLNQQKSVDKFQNKVTRFSFYYAQGNDECFNRDTWIGVIDAFYLLPLRIPSLRMITLQTQRSSPEKRWKKA